jgi:hypothetical protein
MPATPENLGAAVGMGAVPYTHLLRLLSVGAAAFFAARA